MEFDDSTKEEVRILDFNLYTYDSFQHNELEIIIKNLTRDPYMLSLWEWETAYLSRPQIFMLRGWLNSFSGVAQVLAFNNSSSNYTSEIKFYLESNGILILHIDRNHVNRFSELDQAWYHLIKEDTLIFKDWLNAQTL